MIGAPLLVLGLLLTLSAFAGAGVAGRERGAVARFLLSPLHPGTWAALAALLAGFWVELFGFWLVVGAFSAGGSLLVVGIGFVLVALAIELARLFARFERARARWTDPRPLLPHPYRPVGGTLRDTVLALFLDLSRWLDVVYVLIAFPLVVLELVASLVLWVLAIGLLSLPVWHLTSGLPIPAGVALPAPVDLVVVVAVVAGLLLLPVAATVTRGLVALHRAVVVGLLCESEQRALQRRVEALEVSRRTVLDVEASELRRIERDLHDGAQQRLVMLSMQLGLAAERIDTDPAAAKGLVVDARDQARQALAEIRDLVRGIAPAILLDRGLVPALSSLAGRSPVPAVVAADMPEGERLPDAVERGAYFVVGEALANVAKHAGATRCEIRVRREQAALVVEVEDDGRGGAREVPGGGLAGLAGRVEALDGTLTVSSPEGGPTVVRASIPVAAVAAAPVAAAASPPAPWAPPGTYDPR